MKKYETYKDSGIEWIREIPEHWSVKKLKYLAKICNGQDHKSVWNPDGEYPVVGTGGYFGKCDKYLHSGPSVILGRKGTIDKPQYIQEPFWSVDTAYYTDIHAKINPKLFYYLCTTINFEMYKYGSAVPSMTQEALSQIYFSITENVNEQDEITDYLDTRLQKIDYLVTQKEKLISFFEEEKQATINQAVTKGINLNVELKDSEIDWLGDIPVHWKIKKLKYIIKEFESGVSVNSSSDPAGDSEFGILKTSCVYDYTFRPEENKLVLNDYELSRARTNPKEGQIIISRMNTPELVGASGYVEENYPNLFLPDRLWQTIFHKNSEINPKWLSYILKSLSFRSLISVLATGTSPSMKNIGQEEYLSIYIPFPFKEEQDKLVEYLDEYVSKINGKIDKTRHSIKLLKEYKTALISEVVTGKIKVTE